MFEKDYSIGVLLDFYGDILPKNQQEILDLYYNADLSLSEIAENCGLTRQGVRHNIKKGEEQLLFLENKLGVAKRFADLQSTYSEIDRILNAARDALWAEGGHPGLAAELERAAALAKRSLQINGRG